MNHALTHCQGLPERKNLSIDVLDSHNKSNACVKVKEIMSSIVIVKISAETLTNFYWVFEIFLIQLLTHFNIVYNNNVVLFSNVF